MACATISLKRSHDFDPLSPRRPKRRRCTPMSITPVNTTPSKPPSVFKEATPSLSKGELREGWTTRGHHQGGWTEQGEGGVK